MTPHVWTYDDVKAAIVLGAWLGVGSTLALQFLCKGILFPAIDRLVRWNRKRLASAAEASEDR